MIWFAVVSHQNEILEIYTYNASNLIHLGFSFTNFAASDVCRQITCTITTKIILLWVFFMKHLHLKLSWLVSSIVNPPFSEQIDNICRNCFILVSKTAVDTSNKTLTIFCTLLLIGYVFGDLLWLWLSLEWFSKSYE